MANRIGSVGKAGKMTGRVGTAQGTTGSALTPDMSRSPVAYPTTTTSTTTTSTTTTTTTTTLGT